jgi:autotransporter-associated beta strand protein
LTLSGVLGGPGGLWKSQQAASSTLILAGANTYSGTTAINAGNLSIASIQNVGGAPNSLGQPTLANRVIQCGAGAANPCTLIYTGTGDTTDRGLWLNTTALGSALTLRQSGTGLLKFTGGFWATAADATQRRLILDGATAGTGELAAGVTNTTYGSTGIQIVKNGPGTWALSGTNTTVSATSIAAGKLVGVTGGSSSNSACTVSANATNAVRIRSTGGQWAYKTLTFNAGSHAEFDFGDTVVPSATTAPLTVSNLTFVGSTTLGVLAGALTAPYVYAFGPSKTNYEYLSSVLDVVHDSGRRTCLIYSKNRLMEEEKSYDDTHGRLAPNLGAGDPGVGKFDFALYTNSDAVVSNWLTQTTAKPFDYSFLHFSLPDDYGHAYSWSLTGGWTLDPYPRWLRLSYMYAMQKVDGYLGQIFNMLETNATLRGKTAIVLTADHGGWLGQYDHGWIDQPDCFRVGVFVWGPGVAAGADLYQLNPQYRSPGGTGRPDYNAAPQPIRDGDTANLALSLLGLGPIPGSSLNFNQTLGAAVTNLTCVVTGTNLTLSWPADQLGWRLLVQTDDLHVGLGTNWSAWPNATRWTSAVIPVVPGNGSVFFKLAPPSP